MKLFLSHPLAHTLFLSFAAILLAGTSVHNLTSPALHMPGAGSQIVPSVTAPSAAAFERSSERRWQEITAPLFQPDRRYEAAPVSGTESGDMPSADTFRLLGSLAGPRSRKVAIAPGDGAEVVWLSLGDSVHGWRLAGIADDQATLEKSGNRQVLYLYSPGVKESSAN